jgi:glutamyl-tRNA synthetase
MIKKAAAGQVNQNQNVVGAAPAQKAKADVKAGLQPAMKPITKADILAAGGGKVEPKKIRVRFAPSPTGHLHIGGAKTALMNYLFAKKMGGEFVLRVEDTDQMRSKPEFTQAILDGLSWLGMEWDGEPIYQSERSNLYKDQVSMLVEKGLAYKDPEGSGAVFFKMPEEGVLTVNDRVKGRVNINVSNADGNSDYVIQRSDGSPTFLLANVVDDGDQGISHIFRGDDHLSNAARQIPLFRALGYDVPEFYHMPLIHGDPSVEEVKNDKGEMEKVVHPGGKLSKRHGATSVIDYEARGYDPEVFMNHLARMGMNYDTEATVDIKDLAKRFDPLAMSKSPSTLGMGRLEARMLHHIAREKTPVLVKELKQRLTDPKQLKLHIEDVGTDKRPGFYERTGVTTAEATAIVAKTSDKQLASLADGSRARAESYGYMLDALFALKAAPVHVKGEHAAYANDKQKAAMGKLLEGLEKVTAGDWDSSSVDKALESFNKTSNLGYKAYGESLRWMLTGSADGFPLDHLMGTLGRDDTLSRLRDMTKG